MSCGYAIRIMGHGHLLANMRIIHETENNFKYSHSKNDMSE
jgi:hypothetical protein